jgi:hypothetical protein
MLVTEAGIDRSNLDPQLEAMVDEISLRAEAQQRVLTREVARLTLQRGVNSSKVDAVEASAAADAASRNESAYATSA